MSKRSRDKGRRGEKETVDLFRDLGFREDVPGTAEPLCFRCKQYRGADVDGPDIHAQGYGLSFSAESKLVQKMSITAVLAKAEEDAPKGFLPLVRWRKDRQQPTIHMPEWVFRALLKIIKGYYEKEALAEAASDQRAGTPADDEGVEGEQDGQARTKRGWQL